MCEFLSCGLCNELPLSRRRAAVWSVGPLLGLAMLLCGGIRRAMAQTPTPVIVPTWRYDLTHAGQNTNETALTPENVM